MSHRKLRTYLFLLGLALVGCSETTDEPTQDQIQIGGQDVGNQKESSEVAPSLSQIEKDSETLSSASESEDTAGNAVDNEEVGSSPSPEPPPSPTTNSTPQITEKGTLLIQLESLVIEPENEVSPYNRSEFPHWDDENGDGMNTRLEVLALEKIENVGWYSRWDGEWYEGEGGLSAPRFDIDHIVSLKEAWRSGADEWSASDKDTFADDMLNLIAVTASSNRSKGARDAAEWLPPEPSGQCYLLIRVIQVKRKWNLSINQAEYETLKELTESCAPEIPAIPSSPPELSTSVPIATPTALPAQSSSGYGSQFYQTADGSDIDMYDANDNGDINCGELPSVAKPVLVRSPGTDPYRLDGDNDGIGCEG
jgi:hypothetical protein|tara:strand:- start:2110 stop:3207 length:1098 start_codon:yes stop_codon:yes gene_type:complete